MKKKTTQHRTAKRTASVRKSRKSNTTRASLRRIDRIVGPVLLELSKR